MRDPWNVIDLVALLPQGDAVMRELRGALQRVLGCASVLKLGFSAEEDFERLSRTPGLGGLSAQPLLDLQPSSQAPQPTPFSGY